MKRLNIRLDPRSIHAKAEKALKRAVAETIRDHYRTGDPLAIWRNGRVEWIRAEELLPIRELNKRPKRVAK